MTWVPHDNLNANPGPPPAWWETVLAFTSDAIFTFTLDGTVTSWNPGARALYGYEADEMVGGKMHALIPSEREAELEDVFQRVSAGRPVTSFDTVRLRKDGTTVDVSISVTPLTDHDGAVQGAADITRDISDRKRFEQLLSQEIRSRESFEGRLVDLNRELRQRLQDLETLLEVLPVGIGIAHDPSCTELRLNPALAELLRLPTGIVSSEHGFPDDDMPFKVFQHREPMQREAFPLQVAASTGEPVSDVEMVVAFDDETQVALLCFAAPLLDEHEEPRGAVGAFIDVTETRRAERELRQANAIKDEFLGLVSHELRTPLTIVLGLSRFLSRDGHEMEAEMLQDTLVQLRSDAERLSNVIENMLILSRLEFEETEVEPVRVRTIVDRSVSRHRGRFPRRQIETHYRERGLTDGNAMWIEQIIANLLTNAEKYSPPEEPVEVRVESTDGDIEIRVADRGQGLDAEDAARLFEPFYRSERVKEAMTPGLGLGLTVCKRLTELQGGTIQAVERPGGGLELVVRLPRLPGTDEEYG